MPRELAATQCTLSTAHAKSERCSKPALWRVNNDNLKKRESYRAPFFLDIYDYVNKISIP